MITSTTLVAGYKYEIAIRVYKPEIAWIKGPVRCRKDDRVDNDGIVVVAISYDSMLEYARRSKWVIVLHAVLFACNIYQMIATWRFTLARGVIPSILLCQEQGKLILTMAARYTRLFNCDTGRVH
jgi:hypothetical protein